MKTTTIAPHSQQSPIDMHEVEHLVEDAVARAIASPAVLDIVTYRVQESMAVELLKASCTARGLRNRDALTQPQPYNERGDTLMIIPRHFYDSVHALTIQLTYKSFDEATGQLGFDYVLYQENLLDKSRTSFCTPEEDMRIELERQISAIFNPEMVGKSALWTIITLPAEQAQKIFPEMYEQLEQERIAQGAIEQERANALAAQQLAEQLAQQHQPEPEVPEQQPVQQDQQQSSELDSMFAPIL